MADLLATIAGPQAGDAAAVNHGAVLGLSNTQTDEIIEHAVSWAAAHGLLVRAKTEATAFAHIPFCLLPVQV